jgi:hypothetical protein
MHAFAGRRPWLVLVIFLVMAAARSASAADRFLSVDGDDQDYANNCLSSAAPCRTLQNALTFQSQDGDVVKVARGSGYGGIYTGDTSVAATVSGGWDPVFGARNPDPALTVLGHVYTQSYSVNAALIDLTFDGVTVNGIEHYGGIGTTTFVLTNCRVPRPSGILVGVTGSGTVLNIHIVDSTISSKERYVEGAIYVETENGAVGTFLMENSVVEKTAGLAGSGIVGEVYPGGSLSMTIDGSRIYRNALYGIHVIGADLTVTNSTIDGNRRGGIHLNGGSTATISNTVIARNRGFDYAGAIHQFDGTLDLVNSTIRRNRSFCRLAPCGGGVVVEGGSIALTNTIVFENVTGRGGADDLVIAAGAASIDHSDLGDVYGSYSDGGGNLNVDPLCAGRDDDHLTAASPVIDAGTCSGAPASDFEGDPRPTGGGCDMGADEYVP